MFSPCDAMIDTDTKEIVADELTAGQAFLEAPFELSHFFKMADAILGDRALGAFKRDGFGHL